MLSTCTEKFEKPIVVLKFGGSSLATPGHIKDAAVKIHKAYTENNHVIAIVSAMGTTTNELNQLAKSISPTPNRRELDMLISAGERISMSLISMALHEMNCDAISFTGSQAGVLTQGTHNDAHIVDLKPIRVYETLKQNKIAVIAGFQGVNPQSKEITTLGRGGTDITAIAFAAHFKAQFCQFIKDVPGILNSDPKWISGTKIIRQAPLSALKQSCQLGAKVLNPRALIFAEKNNVPIRLGKDFNAQSGSLVTPQSDQPGQPLFFTLHPHVLKLNGNAKQVLAAIHCGDLTAPLSHYEDHDGNCHMVIHPDYIDFYQSFLSKQQWQFTKHQIIAVTFSSPVNETEHEPVLTSATACMGEHTPTVLLDNTLIFHVDEKAPLQKLAQKFFDQLFPQP